MKCNRRFLFSFVLGFALDRFMSRKLFEEYEREYEQLQVQCDNKEIEVKRLQRKLDIFSKWHVLESGMVVKQIIKRGYHNIAIYGLGTLGEYAVDAVLATNEELKIAYIIDKNKGNQVYRGIPVYDLKHNLKRVDAVIVTTVLNFQEVKEEIDKKILLQVVSLEDIIEECWRENNEVDK